MKLGDEKRELRFTIIVRTNSTNKTRSFRIDDENIKSEKQLLELVKKLLKEYYDK